MQLSISFKQIYIGSNTNQFVLCIGIEMKLISIIIPSYNVEKYIELCLKSLIRQTCMEFEVILIDDNSTDKTLEVVSRMKKYIKFPIRIIKSKKNKGAGETRNIGLNVCTTEYFMFLDSDDYLERTCIEKLVSLLSKKKWDCICFDYYINKNFIQSTCHTIKCNKKKLSTRELLIYSNGSSGGKIFKTEIIKNNYVRFPNLKVYEDFVFTKTIMSYCKENIYIRQPFYHYVMHKSSLIHSKHNQNEKVPIRAYEILIRNINKKYEDIPRVLYAKEVIYPTVLILILKRKRKKEICKMISYMENYDSNCYEYMKEGNYSKRLKFILTLVKQRKLCLLKIILLFQKIGKLILR